MFCVKVSDFHDTLIVINKIENALGTLEFVKSRDLSTSFYPLYFTLTQFLVSYLLNFVTAFEPISSFSMFCACKFLLVGFLM